MSTGLLAPMLFKSFLNMRNVRIPTSAYSARMISIDAACSSKRRRNMPGNTAKRRRTCSGDRTAIAIVCRAGRANAKQEGQIPAKAVGDERPVFLEPRHEARFRETGLPRLHPCELGARKSVV